MKKIFTSIFLISIVHATTGPRGSIAYNQAANSFENPAVFESSDSSNWSIGSKIDYGFDNNGEIKSIYRSNRVEEAEFNFDIKNSILASYFGINLVVNDFSFGFANVYNFSRIEVNSTELEIRGESENSAYAPQVGLGYRPIPKFSFGVMAGYIWTDTENMTETKFGSTMSKESSSGEATSSWISVGTLYEVTPMFNMGLTYTYFSEEKLVEKSPDSKEIITTSSKNPGIVKIGFSKVLQDSTFPLAFGAESEFHLPQEYLIEESNTNSKSDVQVAGILWIDIPFNSHINFVSSARYFPFSNSQVESVDPINSIHIQTDGSELEIITGLEIQARDNLNLYGGFGLGSYYEKRHTEYLDEVDITTTNLDLKVFRIEGEILF